MRKQGELTGGTGDQPRGEHGDATWRRVDALLVGRVGAIRRGGGDRLDTLDVVADGVCRVEPLEAAAGEADDAVPIAVARPGARDRQHDRRGHGRAERDEGGDAGQRQSHGVVDRDVIQGQLAPD